MKALFAAVALAAFAQAGHAALPDPATDTDCVIIASGAGCAGEGINPVVAWSDAGLGAPSELPVGTDSITSLAPVADGSVLVAGGDPFMRIIDP